MKWHGFWTEKITKTKTTLKRLHLLNSFVFLTIVDYQTSKCRSRPNIAFPWESSALPVSREKDNGACAEGECSLVSSPSFPKRYRPYPRTWNEKLGRTSTQSVWFGSSQRTNRFSAVPNIHTSPDPVACPSFAGRHDVS